MLPSEDDCLRYVIAAMKGLENMLCVCVLGCIHITLESYNFLFLGW